jgi:hypothetical protein
MKKPCFSLIFLLLATITALGQEGKDVFYEIIEQDRLNVEALALYPEETRNAILVASTQPEVIVRLESIQEQVRRKFLNTIEGLPQEQQRDIYELSRYDGLIGRLADGRKRKSESEIRAILRDYPQEIHEPALRIGRNHHTILQAIHVLNQSALSSFENVLEPFDENVKAAYRHLVELPEVIDILSDNMRLTVTVGGLYQREPQWVKTRLDSLNREAARANAREAEEWKRQLEDNPELLDDFQASAERYAQERGFTEEEYRRERERVETVVYHHHYSYPFWFGYPHWYPFAMWYRWPVWYDWGFYYGPGGAMVLTGMPSFYFTHWYFAFPRNHYYHPQLSNTFISHYQNQPRSATGVSAGVSTWLENNREIVPSNLLAEDGQRVQRMREFGLFETEYRERAAEGPGRAVSREEYLQANARRFQTLAEPGLRGGVEGPVRGEMPRRDIEGEAGRPARGRADGEARDPRLGDPAAPDYPFRGGRGREMPERGVPDRGMPQRETPDRRAPERGMPDRGGPERGRQAPSPERQMPTPQTPPPAQAPPRQTPPPAHRGTPPPQRAPQQAPRQAPRGRPMSIILETPNQEQLIDRALQNHYFIWRK